MMNMLKKRLNKKGFTLAELLIVVAIIAILVAVSIPIFTSRLTEAKKSTDLANMRAAKAAAVAAYLSDELGLGSGQTADVPTFYDADAGVLLAANSSSIIKYGKSAAEVPGASGVPKDKILQVTVSKEGKTTLFWVDPA